MPSWFRTIDGTRVPAVTAEEMAEVDRVAVETVGLPLVAMMENAGRSLARTAHELPDGPVVVLAGGGGNGGGGLAAARHLHNHGVAVTVVIDREPTTLDGATAIQWDILREGGVPTRTSGEPDVADLMGSAAVTVDALVGYGLAGAPRGRTADLIGAVGDDAETVVSLDVPSGVEATSGDRPGGSVTPDLTLTLALPKTGLDDRVGDLLLADIGIPAVAYDHLDRAVPRVFDGEYRVPIHPVDRPADPAAGA